MRDCRLPASVVFVHGRAVSPFIKLDHRAAEKHSPKGIASVCGRGLGGMKNIRKPYHSLMLNLTSLMKVGVDKERVWRRVRVDKDVVLCINELYMDFMGIVH